MRLDKLTVKTQEAVQDAVEIARKRNNQALEPEHVTLALLKQDDGVVRPMLQKVGANVDHVASKLEAEIEKFPQVTGSAQPFASGSFNDVLQKSFDEADKLKDEYVSGDHWLLAVLDHGKTPAARVLKDAGCDRKSMLAALKDVRGTQ
ncbi:MAG: type VI secretion system ATPase TssH, partial [Planctomycetes bacterium]|nr:type VI secretion system ATPase TssH [Planctomycetota bacterium]